VEWYGIVAIILTGIYLLCQIVQGDDKMNETNKIILDISVGIVSNAIFAILAGVQANGVE